MRHSISYLAGAAFGALIAGAAQAQTVVWSSAGDILTFDPQAQSVGINNAALNQVYEPLVGRDVALNLEPGLATSWRAVDTTTWEFKLRQGVKFHDGSPLTAEDVAFSLNRAKAPTSDYRPAVASIAEVVIVDPQTIHIKTSAPSPILPHWLTTIFIMSKAWAEKHNAVQPQNFKEKEESYASRNANGTGPFMLKERTPDVRTVMVANPNYWDRAKYPITFTELEYQPVRSAATRVAGLMSQKIQVVIDPPVQDIDRIEKEAGLKVIKTAEVRSVFLGFDVARDQLLYSDVQGKNPFKDIRVRRAVYQAINNDALQSRIMRGFSQAAGSIIPPGTNGYAAELDTRLPFDLDGAKKLLAEAGYPNGFKMTLECTNNRYINDEAICQAIVPMLARVGITVTLEAKPATQAYAKFLKRDVSFYLLGFGVPTLDAEYMMRFLLHSPQGNNGTWNFGDYSNPRMDALIKAMDQEIDEKKRNEMIAEAIRISRDDIAYIPLHHQVLAWAMASNLDMPIRANNHPLFKYATLKK